MLLICLLKKHQKTDTHILTWDPDSQSIFEKLKQMFSTGPGFSLYIDKGRAWL